MSKILLALLFVFYRARISLGQPTTNPYCSISTCPVNTNTLCKYTTTNFGAACQPADPSVSQVTAADIAIILDLHNNYRRSVAQGGELRGSTGAQPQASNMRQLVWDNELASMAQTLARQCVFEHDQCRDVSRFRVGQNIFMQLSSSPILSSDWNKVGKSWTDEVVNMKTAYVSSFPASAVNTIGHYTQFVWAKTSTIGCGVTSYKSTDSTFPYRRLYVCNYGVAGNFINEPVYTQGPPGSACPAGTTSNNGLCA